MIVQFYYLPQPQSSLPYSTGCASLHLCVLQPLLVFFTSLQHFLFLLFSITSHTATMRRFSSEGSLLDLDFLPWRRVALKNPQNEKNRESGTYTPYMDKDELDGRSAGLPPTIQVPKSSPGEAGNRGLTKEHSVSVENLTELGKLDKSHLSVCAISEGCRAYSDSQLAPGPQGSSESVERDDLPSPFPSSSSSLKSQQRHQHKPKLSAAKLHLKSLFGQVGYRLTFQSIQ